MIRVTDAYLESLITEDVPYIDLTTEILGIGDALGEIEYFTREDAVLCGTEEVIRMMRMLDIEVTYSVPSGTRIAAGDVFLKAQGRADQLHMAWKACLNVFDHYSAISTKTRQMVDLAHSVNPAVQILTTRKSTPGTKPLTTKAVMVGGAFPHRLGLSETVLVFDQHLQFMGGIDGLISHMAEIRSRCVEKKLFVEANKEDAIRLVQAGVDGIQLDKVPAEELTDLIWTLKSINPHITLIAAGGINMTNVKDYASTGVNGIATTALYTCKPLDMSVRMHALQQ